MLRTIGNRFTRFSRTLTNWLASPIAMMINIGILIVWLVTGLIYGFTNTHQLIINTFTTIYTWITTTALLNTQARDSRATHMKLNELLLVKTQARNELIALEEEEDDKLDQIAKGFEELKKNCIIDNED